MKQAGVSGSAPSTGRCVLGCWSVWQDQYSSVFCSGNPEMHSSAGGVALGRSGCLGCAVLEKFCAIVS